jgi:drug/metabolite transporter (DMT)-like permease
MLSSRLVGTGRNAKVVAAVGAGFWGVYWIPLRALDEAGITGGWASLVFFLGPLIICLPIMVWRWRFIRRGGYGLLLSGLIGGTSMVLYNDALIFTEVVRAMLLYYLTPIWGGLLGYVLLGEPITRIRWLSFGLGFLGLMVILGIDSGVPVPRNAGDWMALASGLIWAYFAVRLRQDETVVAEDLTLSYFLGGSIFGLLACALPVFGAGPPPDLRVIVSVLPWLVPALVFIVMTSAFLVIWSGRLLNPGLLGILFMTEISVGTLSAALFAGEPFGLREVLGVLFITGAGLLDALWPEGGLRRRG